MFNIIRVSTNIFYPYFIIYFPQEADSYYVALDQSSEFEIYNYEGEGYNISKGVYTGGMSTIGIQLAF